MLGGLWSTYYYNGAIYGSEIARGFDAWRLTPSAELSANEIKAASEVEIDPADAAAPAAVHLEAELRGRALAPRPARSRRHDRDENLKDVNQLLNSAEALADRDRPERAQEKLEKAAHILRNDPQYNALREAILDLEESFNP